MLALALDTTTPGGSCAIVRDGTVLVETEGDPTVSHAARLPGDLMRALETCSLTLRDVDLFAVATGPGSFTGLRVGIATMQGLAAAAGRPLAGVSAFDAMVRLVYAGALGPAVAEVARSAKGAAGTVPPGAVPLGAVSAPAAQVQVATWVDAWRGEVYAARYEAAEEIEAPSVEPPSRVLDRLVSTHAGPVIFVGSGAQRCAGAIRAALGARAVLAEPAAPAVAAAIAQLALDEAARGVVPPPDEIRPLYVRRLDDEGGTRVAAR